MSFIALQRLSLLIEVSTIPAATTAYGYLRYVFKRQLSSPLLRRNALRSGSPIYSVLSELVEQVGPSLHQDNPLFEISRAIVGTPDFVFQPDEYLPLFYPVALFDADPGDFAGDFGGELDLMRRNNIAGGIENRFACAGFGRS